MDPRQRPLAALIQVTGIVLRVALATALDCSPAVQLLCTYSCPMADNGSTTPAGPTGPAFADADGDPPLVAPSRRSFAVEACSGRKIAGWPLGRFDIGADGLQARLTFPWFLTRSADKDTITVVSVARTVTGTCVRFEDSGQRLADMHVHIPVRPQRIIDQLRRCGYPVTDRKTGQPVIQLPKRRRAPMRPVKR